MILELAAALTGALTLWILVGVLTGSAGDTRRRAIQRAMRTEARRLPGDAPVSGPAVDLIREDAVSDYLWLRGALSRFRWTARRAAALEQARLPLQVSEYAALLLVAAAVTGAIVVFASGMLLAGSVAGAGMVVLIEILLTRRAAARWDRFNEQLPAALQMMGTSLQSGFGILEALRMVAREMEAPIGEEFQTILDEVRAGAAYETSLERLAARVGTTDMRLVTQALQVHRSVGGNLGEILEQVATTIRERESLRRHLHSLTSQERVSAMIVGTLPIWVLLMFVAMAPELAEPLWKEPTGRMMGAAGIGLELAGFLLMRRMMKLSV